MDGFRADPEDLKRGASDILKCLHPAEDIDLEKLSEDAGDFGQSDLSEAFTQFCATWQIAYLFLGSRANSGAEMLNDMAGNYAQSDADAEHGLRTGMQ